MINMNKKANCRYCEEETAMKLDSGEKVIYLNGGNDIAYWYECPVCWSRSPICKTPEIALYKAIKGF